MTELCDMTLAGSLSACAGVVIPAFRDNVCGCLVLVSQLMLNVRDGFSVLKTSL